jgi:hypothetical protein
MKDVKDRTKLVYLIKATFGDKRLEVVVKAVATFIIF